MEIRLAKTEDIPGLLELLRQVGQVHHELRPDIFRAGAQKYDATDLQALLEDSTRPIFVAVEEGGMLGYCFCIHKNYTGDPVLADRKELYIDDLCVDETIRGKHVGTKLYDHVCAYARSIGCRSVTLNVWCGNDSAMAFYEKMGLKPRKIYMETRLEDDHAE